MNSRDLRLTVVSELLKTRSNAPVSKIIKDADKLIEFITNGSYEGQTHRHVPPPSNPDTNQEYNGGGLSLSRSDSS